MIVSSIFLLASALAQDVPLCLSDGQTVKGVQAERTEHRTVRVGEEELRVPDGALGVTCEAIAPTAKLDPEALRSVVLVDGQVLHGTPVATRSTLALDLLDGHRIYVPSSAVSEVQPLRRGEGLEALHRAQSRARMRRAWSLAANIGLGVVGAAAIGGSVYGLSQIPGAEEP